MFSKIFGGRTAKSSGTLRNPTEQEVTASFPDWPPSPLRIIYAGGYVESYYMATPAVSIIERYPRAVLARPDVFRRPWEHVRPWEAVVRPDEILTPVEKLYIVPRHTVLKLQKRARRPRVSQPQPDRVDASESDSKKMSKSDDRGAPDKAIAEENVKLGGRRVRFAGMWQPSLAAIATRGTASSFAD